MESQQVAKIEGMLAKSSRKYKIDLICLVDNNSNETSEENFSLCAWILIILSYILIILTFPITVFYCINVRENNNNFHR